MLISGAVHPIRPTFWGDSNGPMTNGIRANPDPALMSRQEL